MKAVRFLVLSLLLGLPLIGSAGNETRISFTICGGADGGRYSTTAGDIAKFARDILSPKVLATSGSAENLSRLADGTCDAGIAQRDAITFKAARDPNLKLSVETAATLYSEVIHFLCPKSSGVRKLSMIQENPEGIVLFVGSQGGGSHITWDTIARSVKGLDKVPTIFTGGQRAITAVTEGQYEHGGKMVVPCMFWVGGIGAQLMKDADSEAVTLIDLNLEGIGEIKDRFGKPLYRGADIDTTEYKFIDELHLFVGVSSYGTDAVFLVSAAWADQHDAEFGQLLRKLRQSVSEGAKK